MTRYKIPTSVDHMETDTEPVGVIKHFVTFNSPGTFVYEQTQREIGAWDPDEDGDVLLAGPND